MRLHPSDADLSPTRPSRDFDAIQANHDLNRVSNGPVISGVDFARWMWIARTLTAPQSVTLQQAAE